MTIQVRNIPSSITVKYESSFGSCSDRKFFLPNGVALLNNGNIVVADGGNDRICLLNERGETIKSVGKRGYGKYSFTEPVGAFVSPDQKIFITDWHNHRIVIYDVKLRYVSEFGHFGHVFQDSSLPQKQTVIDEFFYHMKSNGRYIRYHFLPHESSETNHKRTVSKWVFLKKWLYWVYRNKSFIKAYRNMYSSYDAMNKPNGVAFWKDTIYVTQKNPRCISEYSNHKYPPVFRKHHFGLIEDTPFHRLANIMCNQQGEIFICDERNSIIWMLGPNFKLIRKLTGRISAENQFLPFALCFITDTVIAVCGGLNFQFIDINTGEVIYCSDTIGELHSIAYNKQSKKLYLANRSNGTIDIFRVNV